MKEKNTEVLQYVILAMIHYFSMQRWLRVERCRLIEVWWWQEFQLLFKSSVDSGKKHY